MNTELGTQAEILWARSEKVNKFYGKTGILPSQEASRLVDDFQRLSETVPNKSPVSSQEDVYHNELKRRLSGESLYLEHSLSGRFYTIEDVLTLYGIEQPDIGGLRGWLNVNKKGVLETIERVYNATEVNDYRMPVLNDIPSFKRQAEEFAATHISNFHKKLSKRFESLTSVGTFLRDITPVPTTDGRSYFNSLTKVLALGIPVICYITEDQSLHINEHELIRLFGHEGMGHGLNTVVTESSSLPKFLKRFSETVRATNESVAQHFEKMIFEVLKSSPDIQNDLGIENKFGEIYRDEKDTQLINEYQRKLFAYAITILADKNLGDMSFPESRKQAIAKRIELLSEVALYQSYAVNIVESNQYQFDYQGNLSFSLAKELVYSAQPARKVIDVMEKKGIIYDAGANRGKIDMLLLSGYWTPIGIVENAQVAE